MNKDRRAPPSMEQARAAWESTENPTYRKVAQILEEQGFAANYRTINRWHKGGWAELQGTAKAADGMPRRIKREILEAMSKLPEREADVADGGMAVALATPPDPKEVADIDTEMNALIGDTKEMLLAEIQERTRMALNVVLMRRAALKAELLVLIPKDTAAFVVSMTDASKSLMSIPAAPATAPEAGRMIDITPNNPLASAIADFKRRTGVAA